MSFIDNGVTGFCNPCQTAQLNNPLQYTNDFQGTGFVGVVLNTTGVTNSFAPLTFHVPLPLKADGTPQNFVAGTATITFFSVANAALNAAYALPSAVQQYDRRGNPIINASFTASGAEPIPAGTVYAVLQYTITNEYGVAVVLRVRTHYFLPVPCNGNPSFIQFCRATNWIVNVGSCPIDLCAGNVLLQVSLNGGGFNTVGTFTGDGILGGTITLPVGQSEVTASFDNVNNRFYIQFIPGLDCVLDAVRINIGAVNYPGVQVQSVNQII